MLVLVPSPEYSGRPALAGSRGRWKTILNGVGDDNKCIWNIIIQQYIMQQNFGKNVEEVIVSIVKSPFPPKADLPMAEIPLW